MSSQIDWGDNGPASASRLIVDTVALPGRVAAGDADRFPGIYSFGLAQRCWSADSQFVFLSTQWRSRHEVIAIAVASGVVTRLTNDADYPVYRLLDVNGGHLLATRSNPVTPPALVIARCNDLDNLQWRELDKAEAGDDEDVRCRTCVFPDLTVPPKQDMPTWEIVPIDIPNDPQHDMEIICLLPRLPVDPAVVLCPHGGPHTATPADFIWSAVALARLDMAVVLGKAAEKCPFYTQAKNEPRRHSKLSRLCGIRRICA